jgi:hypothetical protein
MVTIYSYGEAIKGQAVAEGLQIERHPEQPNINHRLNKLYYPDPPVVLPENYRVRADR